MLSFIQNLLTIDTLFLAIIILISISLHEYAHAWMADRLGDPTPREQWRLTPSPFAHIDPLGFILIFIIGFGRWRPVLYNPYYLKDPLRDELKIALAWPAMNIILAIIGILVMIIYTLVTWATQDLVILFRMQFNFLNIALAVFNLIPLPPLDGYRIIQMFAPNTVRRLAQYGQYILIGFVVLFIFGPGAGVLHRYIIGVSQFIFGVLYTILSYPFELFF